MTQCRKPAFPGPERHGEDAPAAAPARQPEALERIVAAAEIDLRHAIGIEHVTHHLGGEQRADGQVRGGTVMRELVDGGLAAFDQPDLAGDRPVAGEGQPHAQDVARGTQPDQARDEPGMRLLDLPAGAIDRRVRVDRALEIVLAGQDLEPDPEPLHLAALALEGIAQLGRALLQVLRERHAGDDLVPVPERLVALGGEPGVAEAALDRRQDVGKVLEGSEVEQVGAVDASGRVPHQLPEEVERRGRGKDGPVGAGIEVGQRADLARARAMQRMAAPLQEKRRLRAAAGIVERRDDAAVIRHAGRVGEQVEPRQVGMDRAVAAVVHERGHGARQPVEARCQA